MSLHLLSRVLLVVSLSAPEFAVTSPKVVPADMACDKLILVAKNRHFVGGMTGTYFCESIDDILDGSYFLANLKFKRDDVEKDFVGSNLVGWYAIRKYDRAVFEFDIAEGRLGKRIRLGRGVRSEKSTRAELFTFVGSAKIENPTDCRATGFGGASFRKD